MKNNSFRSEFLSDINTKSTISEATLPDYSGDDEYGIEDQIRLIKANPDILAKMKNADKETLEYVLQKWNTFSNNDKQAILRSEYRQKLKDILDDKKQKQEKAQELINNWESLSSEEKLKAFHEYGPKFMKTINNLYPSKKIQSENPKETQKEPVSFYNKTPISKEKQIQILDKNPLDIIYMENPYKETISYFQTLADKRDLGLNTIYNPIIKYYLHVNPNNVDRNNYHKFTNDEFKQAYNQVEFKQFDNVSDQYSLKNLGRKQAEQIIRANPEDITKFTDADENLKLLAIKRNPLVIEDLYKNKMPISKTSMKQAIDGSLNVLKILKNNNIKLSNDLAKYCIDKCPQSIVILVNPSEELKNYAVSKRPTLANKLDLKDKPGDITTDYQFISKANRERLENEDDEIIKNLLTNDDSEVEYDPEDKNFDSEKFLSDKNNEGTKAMLDYIKALHNESLSNYLNRMKKTLLSE